MAERPPPPKQMTKSKLAALQKVLEDSAAVEKIRQESTASIFYDGNSPELRKRHEATRAEFEYIIEALSPDEPVWNVDTIIDRTKNYFSTIIQLTHGRMEEKPRANLLYQRKESIYWWAVRLIPDFPSVFLQWHTLCSAHIGYLAVTLGLSKLRREKNNLTDMEMDVLFKGIKSKTTSTDNWKQHYLAWLLIWTCAVRPGSFTVCPGYEGGASLGAEGVKRSEDETLRWSDVAFLRVDEGIIVQVTFRFTKGQRNPYSRKTIFGQRLFTFLPSSGNRYHLDVATVLTALALSRGLFKPIETWEELISSKLFNVPKDPTVDQQAVFLASAVGKNQLLPDKPMREAALNPALRIVAADVGLWSRNTMYSLRRTAIVETRRVEGTEMAQDLAAHVPGGLTIYAYDSIGLGDLDVTAMRLGEEGTSRADIRAMFAQIKTAKIDVTSLLRQELAEYVDDHMSKHEDYIKAETLLNDSLISIAAYLDLDEINIQDALDQLKSSSEEQAAELLGVLDHAMSSRKMTRKRLRKQLTDTFKADKLAEHKKNLEVVTSGTRATHHKGALPRALREPHGEAVASGIESVARDSHEVVSSIAALDVPVVEEETERIDAVDSAAIDPAAARGEGRQAPATWEQFGDDENVAIQADQAIVAGLTGAEGRAKFVADFIAHSDVTTKGMTCFLCQLDITVPQSQKELPWHRKADLDRHIRSSYHTAAACLSRCSVE